MIVSSKSWKGLSKTDAAVVDAIERILNNGTVLKSHFEATSDWQKQVVINWELAKTGERAVLVSNGGSLDRNSDRGTVFTDECDYTGGTHHSGTHKFTLSRRTVQTWNRGEDLVTCGRFRVHVIDNEYIKTGRRGGGDGWRRHGWGDPQVYKTLGTALGVVRRTFKSSLWAHSFDYEVFVYPNRGGYSITNTGY